MTAELLRAKKHLAELTNFIGSVAHAAFISAQRQQIANIEELLLSVSPVDEKSRVEHSEFRGERRCRIELLTLFEEARAALEDKIEELTNLEQHTSALTKEKKEDYENEV